MPTVLYIIAVDAQTAVCFCAYEKEFLHDVNVFPIERVESGAV